MFYFVSYVVQDLYIVTVHKQCVISTHPLEWWASKQTANPRHEITMTFWKQISEEEFAAASKLVRQAGDVGL